MSAKKIKDLCVVTSKYTNRDGVEKSNYLNIGAIIQKDDGGKFMILNRTFNPAGVPNPDNKDTLIVSMFDVKEKEGSATSTGSEEPQRSFNDEDIPY